MEEYLRYLLGIIITHFCLQSVPGCQVVPPARALSGSTIYHSYDLCRTAACYHPRPSYDNTFIPEVVYGVLRKRGGK